MIMSIVVKNEDENREAELQVIDIQDFGEIPTETYSIGPGEEKQIYLYSTRFITVKEKLEEEGA